MLRIRSLHFCINIIVWFVLILMFKFDEYIQKCNLSGCLKVEVLKCCLVGQMVSVKEDEVFCDYIVN